MKKKLLSLILITALLFCIRMPIQAAPLKAQLGFATVSTALNPGDITAICYPSSAPSEEYLFVVAYYLADGTMASFVSQTVTEKTIYRLTLTIPETVSFGDVAKAMAFNKRTLEPMQAITSISRTLTCTKALLTDVKTSYSGLNERYYTLNSSLGSIGAESQSLSLSSSPTPFRLKDMAEGFVAFEDYNNPRLRLTYNLENGIHLSNYIVGSSTQLWILEEYNKGYTISAPDGGYLAVQNDNLSLQSEKYEWSLNLKGETPFTIMTGLDGFSLMTQEEQSRITEICTSIGIVAFPSMDSNGISRLDAIETSFVSTYLAKDSLTPAEEKEAILSAVSSPVMGSLVSYPTLPTFPTDNVVITQSTPVKTKKVIWDLVEDNGSYYTNSATHPFKGEEINCYKTTVTYKADSSTQNVTVYYVDPDFANVQNSITALGKLPYNYRKFITTMYVYRSTSTSTFNCGASELTVRLTAPASEFDIVQGFAHELGHSCDYFANGNPDNASTHWSQGAKWQECDTADFATVSDYANSLNDDGSRNFYEDFAEFARLYTLSYGNRDLEIGIAQLFPNRFASFQRMLTKINCTELIY